ncbi:MAG: phosphotransferase [Chitinophagaceae bacterium]|nr:phosphotransferase [Chitinophagaceae bacterium]
MSITETDSLVLEQLFEDHFGIKAESVSIIPMSGSDRRYYRIGAGSTTAIGTFNQNIAENNSFYYFTDLFRKHEINVPEIYKTGKDRRYYLQQDLGNTTLFDELQNKGLCDEVKEYYKMSLEQLAKLQWMAGREADYNQCFGTKQFDEKAISADFLYFKYYFADLQKIVYDKTELTEEIEEISKDLGRIQPKMLMYRDFQSRNIMLYDDKVYFIDYQGCMQGPPQYDIASLLWQAKAQLPQKWKDELLNSYITSLNNLPMAKVDEMYLRRGYSQFVMLRLVQVLGAYGFRGLLERKPHFISSISPALQNLATFLDDNPQIPSYPKMRGLLENISSKEIQKNYETVQAKTESKLKVIINSFSYKKGIPKDETENGGGFVFDCRGILNPGRIETYKKLSGLDELVQYYLLTETEMPNFLEHIYAITDISIVDYLHRDFESLQINFGCTGGQHRSVFAAEKLAMHLRTKYNLTVTINHTNQKNWLR